MPKDPSIKKVLVIGSGPIIIGQAAEFDYSGTQACRALKSEGIEVVLVNSNPATIMTDPDIADRVYVEPMTLTVLKRIIEKEKPDSILPNLGGQTGLNLAMELARSGYLEQAGVRLLGAKPDTIDRAEDRQLFKDTMEKLGEPVIPSKVVESLSDALAFAGEIGYPVIVRPAFTMGGTGGGICETVEELHEIGTNGLRLSPIHQVLIEKCISGWKEIEYEVMRDGKGNVITVCNMENFDPVGVHTGDSIVVAPSQTLSDKEYQMLRTSALNIITELGIEGGCNCQFALKPDSFEYAVIEVNPRVSRSSALASKATGYPIAKVAAKIAIGYSLDEITNDLRLLRARAGLLCGQVPEMAVRQIRIRQEIPGHADDGHGRGDGHCQQLRTRLHESGAEHRAGAGNAHAGNAVCADGRRSGGKTACVRFRPLFCCVRGHQARRVV